MNTDKKVHQQRIFDSSGLLPKRNWKTALWHIILLVVVVFVTELSDARADMVFDFQMKLAKKGNAEAQFKVGEMYEAGRGVNKDMDEAMKWIRKAAAQGNSAASYKLLYKDVEENGVSKENKTELVALKNAAHQGDGYAQYLVGLMLSRGVGFKQNSEQALSWLGKASLQGVTAAEAEIVRVQESRTNQRARQQAERQAEQQEKARLEQEKRKKLEAQRATEKRKRIQAANKKKAEQQKIARQREADRIAAEKAAEQQRLIAQKQAQAEKKRQALIEHREKKKQQKKVKFESDPCAGKSARFLSTCR